jgi:hypothetical protein
MEISIGSGLGYTNNANKVAGTFSYFINDTFTTNRSAGAVNGTLCEPGPGMRTVTDTESRLSLTGGVASFTSKASPTNGDPGIWLTPIARSTGVMLFSQVTPSVNSLGFDVGFDSDQATTVFGPAFLFRSTGVLTERFFGGAGAALINYSGATAYRVAICLRLLGHFLFLKVSSNWILLWHIASSNASPLYPAFANVNNTATCDYIKVPSAYYVPAPIASDGFGSAFGTTDGLGHQEGIAGGLGPGGSALAWTQQTGTWTVTSSTANASALSGGLAIATVNTSKVDVIADVKLTRNGGNGSVIVRYEDTSNFVRATHTGTNAQLITRIAGVEVTLIDAAATYVAGAILRVICEGTKFRLYYNNVLIGTEQTIVGLTAGTRQGIRTTDTTNTFDDFLVYARGTSGEYNTLDNY